MSERNNPHEVSGFLFWLAGMPAVAAWLGYGLGWLAEGRLPEGYGAINVAGIAFLIAITPAGVMGLFALCLVLFGRR